MKRLPLIGSFFSHLRRWGRCTIMKTAQNGMCGMELTDLPNIGPVLADNLRRVGITTTEDLRAVGACEAWLRIRARVDSGACLHQLTALAGAEAGIPKKELSPERKAELRAFFDRAK